MRRPFFPARVLVVALLAGCSGSGDTAIPPSPPVTSPNLTVPSTVSGYTGCISPACADAARACDDYLRSGCAPTSWSLGEKLVPGSEGWKNGLGSCASALLTTFHEKMSEEEGEKEEKKIEAQNEKELKEAELHSRVGLVANCTRHVRNCAQMGECFRGVYFPKVTKTSTSPVIPAPKLPDVISWKIPYAGTGPDPLSDTPWGRSATLTVQDSPSCASCAIERCPTFAYLCFGANGTTDCPGGDCCESLRLCISQCGGYEPRAPISAFDTCVLRCSEGRPHAVQQLADLQHCGDVACRGCERFDAVPEKEDTQ